MSGRSKSLESHTMKNTASRAVASEDWAQETSLINLASQAHRARLTGERFFLGIFLKAAHIQTHPDARGYRAHKGWR